MEFGTGPAIGLINIDPDTRKLPLQLPIYPSEQGAREAIKLQWYDTIALAASRAYDRDLLVNHPRLSGLLDKHEHPYISFLKKDEFHQQVLVSEVLAGAESKRGEKTFCPDEKLPTNLQELMSGKVIVIGEVHPRDVQPSVVGKMPGYLMQANFIEALLDERYYRAMPVLDYLYGFLILAALEFILIVFQNQWVKIALLTVVLIILSAAVVYLTLKVFDSYVNPLLVGVTAILVRVMGALFHRVEERASA
jgi:hypothetical protein